MQKHLFEHNAILKLSFDFSLLILDYCEKLIAVRKYAISNQVIRSGTSIGANIMEAQNAESKADFLHKIKVAAKEAEETQYWLMLCEHAQNYPDCSQLLSKLEEVHKVLGKIVSTLKRKNQVKD